MVMVNVGARVTSLWADYLEARSAKSKWTAQEKYLKGQLVSLLGLGGINRPPSMEIVDKETGVSVGRVAVGNRTSLDTKYLREKYPDIYAECERTGYTVSFKDI